jgi:transposase-like protein
MLNLNLTHLMDDAKCYETVRQMRWRAGVCCPKCSSPSVIKRGKDETQPERQRYQCKNCGAHFDDLIDDLTDTIFAGHHQPLRMWLLCLYLMGLNLSNRQIAQELDLDKDVVHDMTTQLRQGIALSQPAVKLSGEVECDEVYVTAGHKGNPEAVRKKGAKDDAIVSKGFAVEARLKKKNRLFLA